MLEVISMRMTMRESWLTRFLDAVSRIVSSFSSVTGIVFIFGMTTLITVDVFGRYIGHSTQVADEFSRYMLVGLAFLGLAYTQRKKRHIQITIITSRLSQRTQDIIQIGVLIVGFLFASWLVWITWEKYALVMLAADRRSLTTVATPLWIPATMVPVGLGMFALELLIEIRMAIINLLKAKDSSGSGKVEE
jgi:TRAP-type C4-dicarboxylate transport system permease small subunit